MHDAEYGLRRTPSRRSSQNFPSRNCLKSLVSLKTNASKPTKQSKEGSFRCDMTAISALETLLSDFLDSFSRHFGEYRPMKGQELLRPGPLVTLSCSSISSRPYYLNRG